jgi:predicted transcriptional regulator
MTHAELLALARKEDRSVSWVLRRALTTYLERTYDETEETT